MRSCLCFLLLAALSLPALALGADDDLPPHKRGPKPQWCGSFKASSSYNLRPLKERWEKAPYSKETILYLARAWCDRPGDAELVKAAGELRSEWMTALGMQEAEMADLAALVVAEDPTGEPPAMETEGLKLADLDALAQVDYARAQMKFGDKGISDLAWWLDSIPQGPSEPLRAYFVSQCIAASEKRRDAVDQMAVWGLCGEDARTLDRKKLDEALAKPELSPATRFEQRILFGNALRAGQKIDAEFTRLAAQDPGVQKLVYDVPKAAREEWRKTVAASNGAIPLALEIEDASRTGSKKALATCNDQLWPHWQKLMADLQIEAGLGVGSELVRDPVGYSLAVAMTVCHKGNPASNQIAQFFSDALLYTADWRGERLAVRNAMAKASKEIAFDKAGLAFSPKNLPKFGAEALGKLLTGRLTMRSISQGIVAKVEPAGEVVKVTFQTKTIQVPVCKNWKETNKIDRIDDDGKIVYRSVCTKTAMETEKVSPEPVVAPAFLAAGVAKGRFASFFRSELGSDTPTVPLEVWDGPAKKKLIARLGVAR